MSIRIEHTEVVGFEHAIRGMRNSHNSWDKSDSYYTYVEDEHTLQRAPFEFFVGENDLELMKKLCKAGTDHRKFMRMITVYVDVTAPMYWWKEFDTYKVGTVRNSCSTMHTITNKEFEIDDFSHEHIYNDVSTEPSSLKVLLSIIDTLNQYRHLHLVSKHKSDWWQIIQLLPSSYNQRATLMLNYEVLANIYHSRKAHKLDEWVEFCKWIETLPYAKELICNE